MANSVGLFAHRYLAASLNFLFFLIYFVQEEMKKEFVEITLPAQLQKLEAILKGHNEGKGFFLGDKVGE